MNLNFIFRRNQNNRFSIETVFESLLPEFNKNATISKTFLEFAGAYPMQLWRNLKIKISFNDIYHVTGDVHYMAMLRGNKSVLTIHDVGSAYQGGVLRRLYVGLFWFWLPAMSVKQITVISEFTKKELLKLVPFIKSKLTVVPNPVNLIYQYHDKTFNAKCPEILIIGTKNNKNIERIFKALKRLPCKLHIVGILNEEQMLLLNNLKITFSNSSSLSTLEMMKAYQDCDLLCFPSTYEGFGMPIIEAQATGRVVVTSNLGAMKEVAHGSACLVDPLDSISIQKGLKKVIEDDMYRNKLINKGFQNVKRFHPIIIAEAYMKVYNTVLNT